MSKIKVTICAGTTCYLMGAAYLQALVDDLDPSLREKVEIMGARCLGFCKEGDNYGKAPFVKINDEILAEATTPLVLDRIQAILKETSEEVDPCS